jgi:hypothetical protein
VPFVARYRKEATGALDDAQLRTLEERLRYLRELDERRAAILDSILRFDIPASHLLWALVGPREKRLCERLEARFASDLSLRPPLRPIRQIEILEPRLAVRRVDRLLERSVEFSLLTAPSPLLQCPLIYPEV